jgi:hypothetical protein
MMSEWSTRKKSRFRGEVLTILAGRHLAQGSRLDDLQVCAALQSNGWDCEMKDVVTILQDMQGRNWVKFEQERNQVTRRVMLYRIEICPEGQDLADELTHHPAVSFL